MHNGALKIAAHHHEGYTKVENSRLTGRNSEFALFPHASFPPLPDNNDERKKGCFRSPRIKRACTAFARLPLFPSRAADDRRFNRISLAEKPPFYTVITKRRRGYSLAHGSCAPLLRERVRSRAIAGKPDGGALIITCRRVATSNLVFNVS